MSCKKASKHTVANYVVHKTRVLTLALLSPSDKVVSAGLLSLTGEYSRAMKCLTVVASYLIVMPGQLRMCIRCWAIERMI